MKRKKRRYYGEESDDGFRSTRGKVRMKGLTANQMLDVKRLKVDSLGMDVYEEEGKKIENKEIWEDWKVSDVLYVFISLFVSE